MIKKYDTADFSWRMVQAAPSTGGSSGGGYSMQQNIADRNFVLANAREMFQVVATNTPSAPLVGQQITIPLRNVGLVKRLIIEITGTVAQGAAEVQSLTPFGLANVCSNINVTDLSNYQRVNTSGWHLTFLASLRRQAAYGASFLTDTPFGLGSNFAVNNCPAAITASKPFRMFYEVPLAYSDTDLRGGIFSAVVNATWQLQLTINPNFFLPTTADPTLGVFQSSTAQLGLLTNLVITVHQIYLDQLPYNGPNPVLPLFDLATGYLIQNTSNTGLVVSQDFPIQYPNFRQILSTIFIYDNSGVLNPGTDINYIGIQAANLVFLYKTDPFVAALRVRNTIGDDLPKGTYCLETRMQPINTSAYGNMQLVINPSAVNAPASVLVGYEMIGIINQVANAGSLAGN
jgi:P3 major capsid protein